MECIEKARKKNSLARALRCTVDNSIYDELIAIVEGEQGR
jgi:predicted RNA-binding protein YlxR (DUF448 family)